MITSLGMITATQIFISNTYQSTDNKRTRRKHLLLSEITIGSKYPLIFGSWMGNNIIVEYNQVSTSIDIRENGDWDFPFRIRKRGNKISVNFGRNADEKIGMYPLRIIVNPLTKLTRNRMSNCNIFELFDRVYPWYAIIKSGSKNNFQKC